MITVLHYAHKVTAGLFGGARRAEYSIASLESRPVYAHSSLLRALLQALQYMYLNNFWFILLMSHGLN